MDADPRLPYETPDLITHGTFESLTQGGFVGGHTDADFPTNTPKDDLRFS